MGASCASGRVGPRRGPRRARPEQRVSAPDQAAARRQATARLLSARVRRRCARRRPAARAHLRAIPLCPARVRRVVRRLFCAQLPVAAQRSVHYTRTLYS